MNVRLSNYRVLPQRTLIPGRIRNQSSQERLLLRRTRHAGCRHLRHRSTCILVQKAITKLQEGRTVKKIVQLDKHIFMAYSGLTADGRILANKARIEAQSFRLNYDDDPSVEYISKFLAETKQKYALKGVVCEAIRDIGPIAGIDPVGKPRLFYTDPSGSFSEWKAHSCGRNSKQVTEYLEKHYKRNMRLEDRMSWSSKPCWTSSSRAIRILSSMSLRLRRLGRSLIEEIEKLIDAVKQ